MADDEKRDFVTVEQDDETAPDGDQDSARSSPQFGKTEGAGALPGTDFATFVVTLATSALLYLGEIPDPDSNQTSVNLPMARQTIDILSMLKKKTEGNLTREEADLLGRFLYDVRMKYVACRER